MDHVLFTGHCPIELGDKIYLKDGRSGNVGIIRTIQDYLLIEKEKKAIAWFEFWSNDIEEWVKIDQIHCFEYLKDGMLERKYI